MYSGFSHGFILKSFPIPRTQLEITIAIIVKRSLHIFDKSLIGKFLFKFKIFYMTLLSSWSSRLLVRVSLMPALPSIHWSFTVVVCQIQPRKITVQMATSCATTM
jgi:hypothetical protein